MVHWNGFHPARYYFCLISLLLRLDNDSLVPRFFPSFSVSAFLPSTYIVSSRLSQVRFFLPPRSDLNLSTSFKSIAFQLWLNPSGSLERFSLLREIALGRWKLRVQFIVMDTREIKIIPLGNDRPVNKVLTCNQSIVHIGDSCLVLLTLFSNYN